MSEANIKSISSYRQNVRKHMSAYIEHNYKTKKHIEGKKLIIKVNDPEEVLLKSNREIYKQYTLKYPWSNIGNMLSSQVITLDYFLPYFNAMNKLSKSLGHEAEITSIELRTNIYDDTHIDVLLQDANQDKITIKVGFTESDFSKKHITAMKLTNFGRYYYRINHLMTKNLVTAETFCENELLYRYILNTFLNVKGEKGTLILLYPRANLELHRATHAFYQKLKDYYGFKYIDRVKLMHFENLSTSQSFINKYLNIKTKAIILSVDGKSKSDLLVSAVEDPKRMISRLNEVDKLDIKIIENHNKSNNLFSQTIAILDKHYDLYSVEDTIDKPYTEYKHVNIDLDFKKKKKLNNLTTKKISLSGEIEKLKKKKDELSEEIKEGEGGIIKVKGTIYPRVFIQFASIEEKIHHQKNNLKYYFDEREIKSISIED